MTLSRRIDADAEELDDEFEEMAAEEDVATSFVPEFLYCTIVCIAHRLKTLRWRRTRSITQLPPAQERRDTAEQRVQLRRETVGLA